MALISDAKLAEIRSKNKTYEQKAADAAALYRQENKERELRQSGTALLQSVDDSYKLFNGISKQNRDVILSGNDPLNSDATTAGNGRAFSGVYLPNTILSDPSQDEAFAMYNQMADDYYQQVATAMQGLGAQYPEMQGFIDNTLQQVKTNIGQSANSAAIKAPGGGGGKLRRSATGEIAYSAAIKAPGNGGGNQRVSAEQFVIDTQTGNFRRNPAQPNVNPAAAGDIELAIAENERLPGGKIISRNAVDETKYNEYISTELPKLEQTVVEHDNSTAYQNPGMMSEFQIDHLARDFAKYDLDNNQRLNSVELMEYARVNYKVVGLETMAVAMINLAKRYSSDTFKGNKDYGLSAETLESLFLQVKQPGGHGKGPNGYYTFDDLLRLTQFDAKLNDDFAAFKASKDQGPGGASERAEAERKANLPIVTY